MKTDIRFEKRDLRFKIVLLFFLPFLTFAQKDTVKVSFSEEIGKVENKIIVDESQYFIMLQEPIKQLLKFQIGSSPTKMSVINNLEYNLSAGYERKLSRQVAINATLDFWHRAETLNRNIFSVIIEPRLYLNQKVSNLSGTYMSLKFQTYFPQKLSEYLDNETALNKLAFTLGVQSRFLRRGLLDLGITTGFETSQLSNPLWKLRPDGYYLDFTGNYNTSTKKANWFVRSEARVGLGISSSKMSYKPTRCDILRCYEPQTKMLKVDFMKMFYFSREKRILNLNIDYECKIANSSWSINQNALFIYNYLKEKKNYYENTGIIRSDVNINSWEGKYSFQPRFYYNLKKRIAYGKSANNLSANYIASINGFEVGRNWESQKYEIWKLHTGIVYGLQRRLVKNGFFDTYIGIAKTLDGTWVDSLFPRNSGLYAVLNLKIGYSI